MATKSKKKTNNKQSSVRIKDLKTRKDVKGGDKTSTSGTQQKIY